MTKYLKNPGAGWDNPGSTPIEDVRAAKKLIESMTGYRPDPRVNENWLMDQVEAHYKKTGIWPTHAILPGGIDVPIPPRSSR